MTHFKKQIVVLLALGVFTISCKEATDKKRDDAEIASIAFKNDIADKVFQHYNHIKTALTKGDIKEAKSGGKMLSETISNNYLDISNLSKEIATSENIEAQQKAFSKLTAAIQPFLESNISEGEIYKQFCPMAFNNEGAYWFSKEENIANPYFEGKMLTCGSVKEVIK